MKKLLICLLASLTFMACSDDDTAPVVTPTERGTVTDNEGNVYNWVRIGDQDWTTTNAYNGEPFYNLTYYNEYLEWEDYIFEFSSTRKRLRDKYVPVYGNLMKYEEAVASAPEGWRLPTDEDWKKLERTLGMGGEADHEGWRGNIAPRLMQIDGGCEMGLLLGGIIEYSATSGMTLSLDLYHQDESGFYWTSTIDDTPSDFTKAFYRKITAMNEGVERQSTNIDNRLMSVRWVRDAQ